MRHIAEQIERFVSELIKPARKSKAKIIHDAVWGSREFAPWEMQLIDSPLFQRLRGIHQVGLASLTYPSAGQSRFEHSSGVRTAAVKMLGALERRFPVSPEERALVTLAALLHDVGHCFFSHLSERLYEPELAKTGINAAPHEIMSALIITSDAFSRFFAETDYPYKSRDTLQNAADMITGRARGWAAGLINGPLDADKLDYLKRDSFHAGLPLSYDAERFISKLAVGTDKNGGTHLALSENGAAALEETAFCRIQLYAYLYRHQKVLITEEIARKAGEIVLDERRDEGFLYACLTTREDEILYADNGYGRMLAERDLPKRVQTLRSPLDTPVKGAYTVIPPPIGFGGGENIVLTPDGRLIGSDEAIRLSEWAEPLARGKWRGFVFG